jgi:hypothetical protein
VIEQTLDSVLSEGLLVDRKWLKERGFDRPAVDYYVRSGKIEAVTHGVYRKPGPPLKWQNVVYSLSELGYYLHVGHKSALSYHGYSHYLALGGNSGICLYCEPHLPKWVKTLNTSHEFIDMPRNPFKGSETGIEKVSFGTWDWPILYSTPERAFFELISSVTTSEEIKTIGLMMEGAVNLRPALLQRLLEECRQVKAKRLFLWIGREQNHGWYAHLDQRRIDIGKGKRQIVKGGILDMEYLITVPRSNGDEQTEPVF